MDKNRSQGILESSNIDIRAAGISFLIFPY
jgi:hypothetical protein